MITLIAEEVERKAVVGSFPTSRTSANFMWASRSALGGQGRGLGNHLNGDAGRVNKKVLRW
ncbi:hypothetical protein JCM18909_3666 [Cutibacterium acnes JCM 18909]|nr:hypothetical protein JCM18909_3666 [Cutibacterium acnes JCM 18909]